MLRRSAIAALVLLPALAWAGGKKDAVLDATFHLQTEPGEGKLKVFQVPTAGEQITYRLSPEFSRKDYIAFRPFPADDGVSYGIIFQLNKTAAQRLANIGNAYRGRYLLAMVNGQVRDAVLIDKAPNDGLLVIWQRVSAAEVRLADEYLPRIGQDPKNWKKQKKKK